MFYLGEGPVKLLHPVFLFECRDCLFASISFCLVSRRTFHDSCFLSATHEIQQQHRAFLPSDL